ncbi:MAG: hypothetical protein P9M14_11315 [Candidatus Alcyoniella australis]|nr:hypothetical protein [Candidatus Alcyoniella australis]
MKIDDESIARIRERLRILATQGIEPDLYCSFRCSFSDSGQAQHAACLAVNGVHCRLIEGVVEKGAPCRVRSLIET